ncbi:unnamed protein product [Fusarium graminearum]|nr:hypothetical protein HG531_011176 [Fusarium graminearum]CAG1974831.1 unnamed protein product [Fusarium graminearum]CAG1978284.1 unnamed protein product [Fusarium graminearum]VTO81249.1 unnamed protein product [Fusarium graminearum]
MIQFSTLYREDWRSLAGCFNLVATYYYVLQQDIVLHLAHLITPEMHMQLEKKFPNFRSKLEIERAFHFRVWDTGDDNTSQVRFRPAACQFVDEFFEWNTDCILPNNRYEYEGYGSVASAMDRLGIPDFARKLPDTWIYEENPLSLGPPEFDDDDLPFDFEFRIRKKIRFSAAASAIRFIGLLSTTQRTSIRTIVLHEDSALHYETLIPNLSRWLLNAAGASNEGIPVGSLTLLLETDDNPKVGTDIFQQRVHYCIARDQAWPKCLAEGLLQPLTDSQVEVLRGRFTLDDDFKNAIVQLVNQSSTVFRCGFDPGVPQGCEAFVNTARAIIPGDIWEYWSITEWLNNYINLSRIEEDKDATLRQYDIQTSQECILSWVSIGALWETQDDR